MSEEIKRKLLFVILVFLIIVLAGLSYLIYRQIGDAREVAGENLSYVTVTSSSLDNVSVSYDLGSPTSTDVLDDVKDTVNRFMEAKIERSLEAAKPYMTEELYKSTTQDSFAGTSSPSMDRFQVTDAQAVKTPNTYQVDVTSYWKLNGEESDNIKYSLIVIKKDDAYLVSQFKEI